MYRWATTGKTSSGEPLDVVHDVATNQYYVAEASLAPIAMKHKKIAAMSENERFKSVGLHRLKLEHV